MKKYNTYIRLFKLLRMCLATQLLYGIADTTPDYQLTKSNGPPENVSRDDRIYQETRVITSRDVAEGYYDNAPPEEQNRYKKYHIKHSP